MTIPPGPGSPSGGPFCRRVPSAVRIRPSRYPWRRRRSAPSWPIRTCSWEMNCDICHKMCWFFEWIVASNTGYLTTMRGKFYLTLALLLQLHASKAKIGRKRERARLVKYCGDGCAPLSSFARASAIFLLTRKMRSLEDRIRVLVVSAVQVVTNPP